jgi:hypothetical protein
MDGAPGSQRKAEVGDFSRRQKDYGGDSGDEPRVTNGADRVIEGGFCGYN